MFCAVAQMIQLTYQPAFDPSHTVFRFLRLRQVVLAEVALPRDHLRVLDFYLMFPFRSDEIRVFPRHRKFKKLAQQYAGVRPYGDLPDDRVLFHRMSPIQGAALDTLAQKGLLDAQEYKRGIIAPTATTLPAPLQAKLEEANVQQKDLLDFLTALATDYDLLGSNGLKDRSGLMDFAYDAA